MNATITNAPSPSAAERMRIYRKRRRNGLRSVRVLLAETEIDSLICKGFLNSERRHSYAALEHAVGTFIISELGSYET
jgi:hypothetical protein